VGAVVGVERCSLGMQVVPWFAAKHRLVPLPLPMRHLVPGFLRTHSMTGAANSSLWAWEGASSLQSSGGAEQRRRAAA
jgi:hypothetical protein